jgi:hypothetical protein
MPASSSGGIEGLFRHNSFPTIQNIAGIVFQSLSTDAAAHVHSLVQN